MTEIPYDKNIKHGWWADREDHIDLYHGTHEKNVPHIAKSGVSVPDPRTGMVSMTPDPNTAHGYAAMSSGERRGEHSFRKAGAKAETTPHENRAVTKFRVPMSWVKQHVDPNLQGNIGVAANRMKDKGEYEKWRKENPKASESEYYMGTELRFSKPVPPEFYVGHMRRYPKSDAKPKKTFKQVREELSDPMITHRKKIDAKRLTPGSRGGEGGGSDGSSDGGSGGNGDA